MSDDRLHQKFSMKVAYGNIDGIRKMIADGYDVNSGPAGDDSHVSVALTEALRTVDPEVLQALWKAGARVDPASLAGRIFAAFEAGGDGIDLLDPTGKNRPRKEKLVARFKRDMGTLRLKGDHSSITIPIKPFRLDSERVETSVRLDSINLPATWEEMEGQTFDFPVNPDDGYIDGSIYLRSAHSPVNVTRIKFGVRKDDLVEATLTMEFDFDFEGVGQENESARWKTKLRLEE